MSPDLSDTGRGIKKKKNEKWQRRSERNWKRVKRATEERKDTSERLIAMQIFEPFRGRVEAEQPGCA